MRTIRTTNLSNPYEVENVLQLALKGVSAHSFAKRVSPCERYIPSFCTQDFSYVELTDFVRMVKILHSNYVDYLKAELDYTRRTNQNTKFFESFTDCTEPNYNPLYSESSSLLDCVLAVIGSNRLDQEARFLTVLKLSSYKDFDFDGWIIDEDEITPWPYLNHFVKNDGKPYVDRSLVLKVTRQIYFSTEEHQHNYGSLYDALQTPVEESGLHKVLKSQKQSHHLVVE